MNKTDQWKKELDNFSKVADNLGIGIDSSILDLVVGLNIFGITTIVSCEGHVDDDEVRYPWVGFESELDIEQEKEFKKIHELINSNGEKLSDEEKNKLRLKAQQIYWETRKPNLEICRKLLNLLSEFYQNRTSPYDVHLHILEFDFVASRMENIGSDVLEILPKEEQVTKLKEYQKEMVEFGEFLKRKHLDS
ncbi:MAG: hypothetical protein LBG64_03400 [Pseudomonadales bacterium]|jgi:hypothetical protein|nr:hypothetical protein [Pseudomonadales bacterium]